MRRLITCFILALVSCIAFAKPQTKYSIKIIGEDFNALKFIVSKKGYLSTTLTAEPDKTEITLVLKMDPNKPLSKKAKKNKKK